MSADPTFDITEDFSDPFYEGTGARDLEETGLPVSLNGRGFVLDLVSQQFQRRSVQLINTQQQDSSNDGALLQPEVWRRVIDSWHFGEAQTRYDRDGSLPFRFDQSAHVDVWNQWGISLLNETHNIHTLPAGPAMLVSYGGSKVFVGVVNTTTGYWWANLTGDPASPPVPVTMTLPEAVLSACTDGQNLFTLGIGGVVRKWTSGTASTVFATVTPFNAQACLIRYVKGFVVVASGNTLWDVTTGTQILIGTHPLIDYHYVDACDGLSVAYFLGGMGDRWNVSSVTLNDDRVSLAPPVHAAPLPDGEIGYSLGSYLGYVLVGLNTGFRFGVPAGDGSLTFGRLVSTKSPVRCFEGQDSFVWFGMDLGPDSGLGRCNLATFVAPMTPAFAADLTSGSVGAVRGAATIGATANDGGRRVFTVDGVGVFLEQDTLCPTGYLDQGIIAFNTSDPKIGLYAQVYCEPLQGEIDVDATWDLGTTRRIGGSSVSGVTSLGNLRANETFTSVKLRYTLTRNPNDSKSGPRMTRVEFRATGTPGRSSEWHLPLLIHVVIDDNNTTLGRDVEDDYDMLIGLVETRTTVSYREGERRYEVYATEFVWIPHHMTEDGRTYEGTFLITVRETR